MTTPSQLLEDMIRDYAPVTVEPRRGVWWVLDRDRIAVYWARTKAEADSVAEVINAKERSSDPTVRLV